MLKPMPGRAFIRPESRFLDTGLIVIPDRYKAKKKAVARVESWVPEYRFKCKCGTVQHIKGPCRHCQRRDKMKMISTVPVSPFDGDITGLRVLYVEAAVSKVDNELFSMPIDDIIAIIGNDVDMEQAQGSTSVKRCKFCGPAKEGSPNGMMMVARNGKDTCPRCNRTETGETNTEKDAPFIDPFSAAAP